MRASVSFVAAVFFASAVLAAKEDPPLAAAAEAEAHDDFVAEKAIFHPDFKPTTRSAVFLEQFVDGWNKRWSPSEATKKGDGSASSDPELWRYRGQWEVEEPTTFPGLKNDRGLVVKTDAAHHAISAQFDQALDPEGKDLVVQYEVKLQKGLECGGAYLKLLQANKEEGIQAKEFTNDTPYTIMFGPDKCGSTNKVHFIFRHKNPKTGEFEEKHLEPAPRAEINKLSSLYTLIVHPDNTFEIRVNNEKVSSGSLLEDFKPAVNPPKEISDPEDKKPADWVDEKKIADPDAKKPDDWDEDAPLEIEDVDSKKPEDWLENEPEMVSDPDAIKPEDWNDEEDGEWVAPLVPNPKCEKASGCGTWRTPMKRNPDYKGKWVRPMIDNPKYKGPWNARLIPNPDYYEDNHPAKFNKMSGIGFELWTMQGDILFDNIFIGHDVNEAEAFAEETWKAKYDVEKAEEDKLLKLEEKPESANAAVSFSNDPTRFVEERLYFALSKALGVPAEDLKQQRGYILGAIVSTFGLLMVATYTFFFSSAFSSSRQRQPAVVVKPDEPVILDDSDMEEEEGEDVARVTESGVTEITETTTKHSALIDEADAAEAQVKEMEVLGSQLKNRSALATAADEVDA